MALACMATLVLCACGQQGGSPREYQPYESTDSVIDSVDVAPHRDTVAVDKVPSAEEQVKDRPASSSRVSSSRQARTDNNMRGFDPASEDDTDDNGMSRYMENNDDEGWD